MKKRMGFIAMLAVAVLANTASVTAAPVVPAAKYSNEWTFELDNAGTPLSLANNSGTNSPLAQFSSGFGSTIYTTNRVLICVGKDDSPTSSGVWTNGALLDAALNSYTSGVHYLRYDLTYKLSSTNNINGTVLGVYFTGGSGDRAAGLVLGYDDGNLIDQAASSGRTLSVLQNELELEGSLTSIAEVDLSVSPATLKVWYSLNGSTPTNYAAHSITTNLSLTSITNLRFHATGDFRPAGSTDFAQIDNIRHTIGAAAGGAAWSEITESVVDLTKPPALTVEISDTMEGGMLIGQTNVVSVAIRNTGSPATDTRSLLTFDSSFTLIASNNTPVVLDPNSSITNTYTLVAGADGTYTLTAQALSTQTNSAPKQFTLIVGASLGIVTPVSVIDTTGGADFDLFEPGETLQISLVTTNTGVRSVPDVQNTLQAKNGNLFTINNLTPAFYPSVGIGATTSTVYQVVVSPNAPHGPQTFYVTNSSPDGAWSTSFTVDIFRQAIPGVSTNELTLIVPSGEVRSGSVTLNNSGNEPISYSVSDDKLLPFSSYSVTTQSISRVYLNPPDTAPGTVFTNWSGGWSAPVSIGFDFPVFGKNYHSFSVSRQGVVRLIGVGSDTATLQAYGGMTAVPTESIRFEKKSDRLLVAWGNGGERELQAFLESNGVIKYLYESGTWSGGTIGVSDNTLTQALQYTPGLTSRGALVLKPEYWVSYGEKAGSIAINGTGTLTFSANASGRPEGTNSFSSLINWNNGSVSTVQVSVVVVNPNPILEVPSSFTFLGRAGLISSATMPISNSGNASLEFRVSDSGLQGAGYSSTNQSFVGAWEEIPATSSFIIQPSQLGTRSIPIGFPFPYFGKVYTSAVVRANGSVVFGDQDVAVPFSAGISLDGNSSVRSMTDLGQSKFSVTWENVAQAGGSSDQTFQAVFNRDGTIRFNYQRMGAGWSNGVVQLRDAVTTISTNLVNSQTLISETNTTRIKITTVTTNEFGFVDTSTTYSNQTTVITRYTDTANGQSLLFTPGKQRIISASPLSGSLAAGASTNIVITGDARALKGGGGNDVTNSTTLTFSYAEWSTNAVVTFIATNSVQTDYPAFSPLMSPVALSGMWGTENPVFSSEVNADGTRTLSWPAANDGLSRTYKVYYATSLSGQWHYLGEVKNDTMFIDSENIDAPVIFYKVTVE